MKYYRSKKPLSVDYSGGEYQLCWTCRKACGGCSWSRSFVPVRGWTATPSHIPSNGEYADTYNITECPEYMPDKR